MVGWTENDLCPVAVLLPYLAVRGNEVGPLFQWKDKWVLTREGLVTKLKGTLKQAGIDCMRCSGQSFRIGAATIWQRPGELVTP